MKRLFLTVFMGLVLISNVYAADQWDKSDPAGTESPSDIDSLVTTNNSALDRLLIGYVKGADVAYASATTVTVSAGEVACPNSAGSVVRWRRNTSSTNVTFADIDTGVEAAGVYYVYAIADTDATTMTFAVSTSSSAPTGKTYYKRLGYFTNDGSLDITASSVIDDDGTAVGDGSITTAKLGDLAVTNAKIAATTIDLTTKVTGELPNANLATITTASKVNTSSLTGTTYLPDATVDTTALKTATSEVSKTGDADAELTFAGGQYCHYPQIKMGSTVNHNNWQAHICSSDGRELSGWTSYVTNITLRGQSENAIYAISLYHTSSGEDYWLFILVNKLTKEILSMSGAQDHPAYGNSNDFDKQPHPFGSFNPETQEIVLIEVGQAKDIQDEAKERGLSVLESVNNEYKIDYSKIYDYTPIHSGQFSPEHKPVLVEKIPTYIQVRRLKKTTESEKLSKKARQKQLAEENNEKAQEEVLITQEQRKQAISALKASGKVFKHQDQ